MRVYDGELMIYEVEQIVIGVLDDFLLAAIADNRDMLAAAGAFNDPELDEVLENVNENEIFYDEISENDDGDMPLLEAEVAYITIQGEQFSTALTELELVGRGLTNEDIVPLRYMINLTRLDLGDHVGGGNYISDLASLSGLTGLTSLWLPNNEISDISPLSGLVNLRTLSLSGNLISDISPLAGLTELTWLSLSSFNTGVFEFRMNISDISPLAGLTELTTLDLSNNPISNLSPLAGLTNLWWLWLQGIGVNDISPLVGLENLAHLNLIDNRELSDISPLAGLKNLETVMLIGNPVIDFSPVEHVEHVLR